MILSGLNDQSHNVAADAITASTALIGHTPLLSSHHSSDLLLSCLSPHPASLSSEPEVMMFEGVISPLLIVMQRCLESGDEDVVAEGLELIQTCTAMEQPLVNDHIRSIISFTVQIIGNAELESVTRNAAHQTMLRIIQLRP
jgi:hypothetical protein